MCNVALCSLATRVYTFLKIEGAHFIECDASHPEQVEAAVATALELMDGRLDVLINNVGAHFEPGRACHELSVEAWDRYEYTVLLQDGLMRSHHTLSIEGSNPSLP